MIPGNVFKLAFCVVFFLVYLIYYTRCKRGEPLDIRPIAGLDAIDDAVGRCTEMGRPVHYTFGRGEYNSAIMSSFEVLNYTATKCAETGTGIIVSTARPEVHAITEELVSSAYKMAGAGQEFKQDNIRFFSDLVRAYTAGIYGIFTRERPGANIMLGHIYGESMMLGEVGHKIGAIQIGGSSQIAQVPFLVATCDYTLIGDEPFAAGAYVTREPSKMATIAAQDFGKIFVIGATLLGTILSTFGNTVIADILKF